MISVMTAALVLIASSTAPVEPQPAPMDTGVFEAKDGSWRVPQNCGPNALYAFLKLHGTPATLERICELAPPGENGVSLSSLCDASCILGLPAQIVQLGPADLRGLAMPVIAHLDGFRNGHFAVVLSADLVSVVTADLINCKVERVPLERFKRNWSGYILERKPGFMSSRAFWVIAIGLAIMSLSFLAGRRRKDRSQAPGGTERTPSMIGRLGHARLLVALGALFAASAAVYWGADGEYCSRQLARDRAHQITIRETPLAIRPLVRQGEAARDDNPAQTLSTFRKLLRPDATLKIPSVSYLVHLLAFWGVDGEIVKNKRMSGDDLLRALLDGKKCDWYAPSKPLFFVSGDGEVRAALGGHESVFESGNGEAHADQVLATLGSLGVPASRRIGCLEGAFTVGDAVRSSLNDFVAGGDEIEFSLMAYLRYLPPERQWRKRWGDLFTFDSLAEQLTRREHGVGMCTGTHALGDLAAMLRINGDYHIISPQTASRVEQYLLAASDLLAHNQRRDGSWSKTWSQPRKSNASADTNNVTADDDDSPLQVTGHHLEWIMIAPANLRPDAAVVRKAISWCRRRLAGASVADVRENICEYEHAIRAVALYLTVNTR